MKWMPSEGRFAEQGFFPFFEQVQVLLLGQLGFAPRRAGLKFAAAVEDEGGPGLSHPQVFHQVLKATKSMVALQQPFGAAPLPLDRHDEMGHAPAGPGRHH
jgi:hypothetical protein